MKHHTAWLPTGERLIFVRPTKIRPRHYIGFAVMVGLTIALVTLFV
ncbi:MAG: hypothetical protein NT159_07815 [Proteobacteria bacterium]|nr:hypothetical protein [Pseudomonadota bacterium]